MNLVDLQKHLRWLQLDVGQVDGVYGPRTRGAILSALTAHHHPADIASAAKRLRVSPATIIAVRAVEASGAAFTDGRPTILFEPHRFSRSTAGVFDRTNPTVSYPDWDRTRYPAAQAARYDQLLIAVGLDVDAGFASASYGAFQILGENYALCGFHSPAEFAFAQARGEEAQLASFIRFVEARGLVRHLRSGDWAAFARGYNGTAYRANRYDERLAQAFAAASAAPPKRKGSA